MNTETQNAFRKEGALLDRGLPLKNLTHQLLDESIEAWVEKN